MCVCVWMVSLIVRSTGFCFAVAYPADLDDPYLLDWVKPASNPIRCDLETQRDPSSAWRTSFGEWRMTYFHGGVYTSQDFKRWDYVGGLFGGAECPDFYPLPNPTPGSEKASGASGKGQDAPNYVHATSGYQVGVYAEGARNTTGTRRRRVLLCVGERIAVVPLLFIPARSVVSRPRVCVAKNSSLQLDSDGGRRRQ